jgi:chorismate dehydratase
MHKHWKHNVEFLMGKKDYEYQIKDTSGGLIIGDRAFKFSKLFPYQYDLAEEWIKMSQLPFVFAAWISNKKLPAGFEKRFNESLEYGISQIHEVIKQSKAKYANAFDVEDYFLNCIDFRLDKIKKGSMQLFLKNIHEMELELVSN